MSGQPPERPEISDFVGPEHVAQEINFIEYLQASVTGQDDYLEAVLENQRLTAMRMLNDMQSAQGLDQPPDDLDFNSPPDGYDTDVRPVPMDEFTTDGQLPIGAVGLANRRINSRDTGPATFQVSGTVFSARIRLDSPDGTVIGSGAPVKVIAPGNICEPINDVSLSLLGFSGAVGAESFERYETPADVTIQPGEEEYVLRKNVQNASWISTGTNDETHSLYKYFIDGEPILEEPLKEPLGLYNDPFRFPDPLSAGREIAVKVKRQSSASGPESYYSKVDYL